MLFAGPKDGIDTINPELMEGTGQNPNIQIHDVVTDMVLNVIFHKKKVIDSNESVVN